MILCILFLFVRVSFGEDLPEDIFPDPETKARYEETKRKLEELNEQANSHPCWQSAQKELRNAGCSGPGRKTYDDKTRLAIRFASCHLKISGIGLFPICEDDEPNISNCIAPFLDPPMAYLTLTEFVNHVDNLCAYERNEYLHEQSVKKIVDMYTVTLDTAKILRKLHNDEEKRFTETFKNMELADTKTRELAEKSKLMGLKIDDLSQKGHNTAEVLRELGEKEQRRFETIFQNMAEAESKTRKLMEYTMDMSEKLDEIQKIDLRVLLELFSMKCFIFYFCFFWFCQIATMFTQTENARARLFLLCVISAIVENFVTQMYGSSMELVENVGYCRGVSVLSALLIIFHTFWTYRDPAQETLQQVKLLRDSHASTQRTAEAKRLMNTLSRSMSFKTCEYRKRLTHYTSLSNKTKSKKS